MKTPAALEHLLVVALVWAEAQGGRTPLGPPGSPGDSKGAEPPLRHAGDPVVLTSKELSQDELDAVIGQYADGIVKEKAVEFIKGFVTGVMLAAG